MLILKEMKSVGERPLDARVLIRQPHRTEQLLKARFSTEWKIDWIDAQCRKRHRMLGVSLFQPVHGVPLFVHPQIADRDDDRINLLRMIQL
jgi:hypothetical protein